MVKANAYGHGLKELIEVFAEHSDELGVATLDEGLQIRSWLPRQIPVFVMSRAKNWENRQYIETLRQAQLIPAISSLDELHLLLDRLGKAESLRIELKLDTGMGRLGIQENEVPELVSILQTYANLDVVGILTHFAASDEEDLGSAWEQETRFRRMLSILPEDLVKAAAIHSCNSGALLQRAQGHSEIAKHTDVVRPGVMLYGAAPSAFLNDSPAGKLLTPVGRWTTRIIEVRTLSPGDRVGYGGTWKVEGEGPVQVAVLAVGYADGFRRGLGNRARVLIRGGFFPVIGRVSMDLISVLVDNRVRIEDEAVLLGAQQGDQSRSSIPAWEWSKLCDTIPYEIWTGISSRVTRVLE